MKKPTWSRRELLELGAAAAGVSLAAKPIRMRRVAPSDTVRFGMVGVGMQGNGLLRTSIQLPGVTCAAAADLYDGRHTLAKEIVRPDLPTTREYRRLLDDKTIDCIVAAVPDHWHKRMVVEAVSAGKDIYIEKPMSHTPADGVAMVDAVKKSGRILQVGSQRVSSQICAKAKEMLAQGMPGAAGRTCTRGSTTTAATCRSTCGSISAPKCRSSTGFRGQRGFSRSPAIS